jgi:Class II flagellar assembly regulator
MMRVEGPSALLQALLGAVPAVTTRAAAAPFDPLPAGPQPAAAALTSVPPGSVAMLVALAAAEPPEATRRAVAVRVAGCGLAGLEELHRDLIAGVSSPQRLRGLRDWAKRRPRSGDPELEAVLDEVELRILIELAKRGAA